MIDENLSLYRNYNEIKGVSRNFPRISPKFFQNFSKISSNSYKIFSKSPEKNPKSENEFRLRISEPKFYLNLYRIRQRIFRHLLRIYIHVINMYLSVFFKLLNKTQDIFLQFITKFFCFLDFHFQFLSK